MDIELARETIAREIQALQEAVKRLDKDFEAAVSLIHGSRGKVIVSGLGKSGIIGEKIAATLSSTGTPAFFLHPVEALHGDLGIVQRTDVGLLLSKSGETPEVLQLFQYLKRTGLPTIALAGRRHSTLARQCDIFIDGSVDREACPLNLAPTSSTLVAMALGDALAACLMARRGFSENDFSRLHPSGALGKRLLLRVKDVMRQGAELPVIRDGTKVSEALIVMTSKGMGAVVVISADGRLKGIFTDGDLRRAIQKHPDLLHAGIDEVMTGSPVVIHEDRLATEAIGLMENRPSQISVLPVLDADDKVVGLIRLHDLIKAGL